MENIYIDDKYTVRDGASAPLRPKGIVKFYDDKGNILFENHNMVVESGRRLLFDMFMRIAIQKTDGSDQIANVVASAKDEYSDNGVGIKVNFSYLDDVIKTNEKLTINEIRSKLETTNATSSIKIIKPTIEANRNDLSITFKTTISGNESFTKFNQVYLTFVPFGDTTTIETVNDDAAILFSRVALDPVYIGAEGTYTLFYTLYF